MNMDADFSLIPFKDTLPAGLLVVIGQHALTEKMLELVAALALKQRATILDCGNRSNMYAVAKTIRPYTSDPAAVMANIRLSRAFTCYQVLAMLEAVAAAPPHEPLIVLDLLATFLDEDVELKDSQRLLTRSLTCLRLLGQSAPVVVSAKPVPQISAARTGFLDQLRSSSDMHWEEPSALPAEQGLQPTLFAMM